MQDCLRSSRGHYRSGAKGRSSSRRRRAMGGQAEWSFIFPALSIIDIFSPRPSSPHLPRPQHPRDNKAFAFRREDERVVGGWRGPPFRIPNWPSSKGWSHVPVLRAFREEISSGKASEAPSSSLFPCPPSPGECAGSVVGLRGRPVPRGGIDDGDDASGIAFLPPLPGPTSFPDIHPGRHSGPAPITRSSAQRKARVGSRRRLDH